MPICGEPRCRHGANGKRFSGSAEEVHEHELAVHGKLRSGRTTGRDIVLPQSKKALLTDKPYKEWKR